MEEKNSIVASQHGLVPGYGDLALPYEDICPLADATGIIHVLSGGQREGT